MGHSFAENATVNCPHCGNTFRAPIWVIVDIVERLDLRGRIIDATLHKLICPNCSKVAAELDAPLLVYLPDRQVLLFESGIVTSILFSPAQDTTTEQTR